LILLSQTLINSFSLYCSVIAPLNPILNKELPQQYVGNNILNKVTIYSPIFYVDVILERIKVIIGSTNEVKKLIKNMEINALISVLNLNDMAYDQDIIENPER